MKLKFMILGALLCLFFVNQISAQCLCASKGLDFCSCGAAPKAVRPVPKYIPRLPAAKFPPIGDSCGCSKQVVEPAIPPKPVCKPPPGQGCRCSCSCPHGAELPPAFPPALPPAYPPAFPPALPPVLPPTPAPTPACYSSLLPPTAPAAPAAPAAPVAPTHPPGAPADPLSISLALTAGKSFAVPEAKLNYGPAVAPLNVPASIQKIYFSNVPEEKLYALNAQILEFKKKFPAPTKAELLAEAIEDAEEEQAAAAAAVPAPAPYLSYSDLGYSPAMIPNPMFLRLRNAAVAQQALAPVGPPRGSVTGCGYVPGKVTQAAEYVEQPLEYGAPCM